MFRTPGLLVVGLAALLWTCASADLAGLRGAPEAAPVAAPDKGRAPTPDAYYGSQFCLGCHYPAYQEWSESAHHRTVREPTEKELERLRANIFCAGIEPDWVLGGTHHLRFLLDKPNAEGEPRTFVLPCSYNVHAAEWELLNFENWDQLEWQGRCQACHVTGLRHDVEKGAFAFAEQGVGCESCHGPGSRHGGFADKGDMVAFGSSKKAAGTAAETMVCASCHLQGGASRTTGFPYAHNYTPGDDLLADLAFDWKEVEDAEKNPIDVHQKLMIKQVLIDGKTDLSCTSCHSFHAVKHEKHKTLPRSDYCFTCHLPDSFKVREYRQGCNVCQF